MNKEDLIPGALYIIKDSFFNKVKDPYLMCNHRGTRMRPSVFLFIELSNGLALMAPLSSKANKYDSITKKLNEQLINATKEEKIKINNKLLGYFKSNVNNIAGYILLLDMFVVDVAYIKREYMNKKGLAICLGEYETTKLVSQAKKVYDLLRSGFEFISTQPDFNRIEKIMILESKKDK